MNHSLSWLTQETDFILAERTLTEVAGPHFRIRHKERDSKDDHLEIVLISLVHGGREYPIRLAPGSAVFFDYLAHMRLSRSAAQIVADMNTLSRASIKVYVNRIRLSLRSVFQEAGLQLDPCKVLTSDITDTNVVAYRLRSTFEWLTSG